ncbi:glycosyltransferase family 4 protein [Coxiella-like endosymbiont of Rhipicephalus sanguineus]|uniref:glycosyltransferase family 4 protein n=1 Tax=Coxiella-like endosymbiont of Rhipicephalus sanguineus TaxID=1955402 RepID=UPI0020410B9F|nr:glycosyltransferase [Coxiella-like endosymbiont of Rhipicephalus sanguineus]
MKTIGQLTITMNKKNLILIAIPSLDVGGSEKHLLRILPLLKQRGYNVALYVTNHRGIMYEKMIAAEVPVIVPPFCEFLNKLGKIGKPFIYSVSILKLCLVIFKYRPSILHFFLPGTYVLGTVSGLMMRAPCMVMSRRITNEYHKMHPIIAQIEPFLHKRMRAILATSLRVRDDLLKEGVSSNKLGLIYNGVNLDNYQIFYNKTAIKRSLCLAEDDFIIINVANLYKRKGQEDLLHALNLIKEKLPKKWRLLCIGRNGGERKALEDLRDRLNLKNHVIFLGQRHDVSQLLAIADVGVLSSHEEGFSNALLECMVSSLPMVVTDVGGNAEAVIHHQSGLVVPPKEPQQLAGALLTLITDEEKRKEYGRAARERIVNYFSLQTCVDRYDRFYQALLQADCHRAMEAVAIEEMK